MGSLSSHDTIAIRELQGKVVDRSAITYSRLKASGLVVEPNLGASREKRGQGNSNTLGNQ